MKSLAMLTRREFWEHRNTFVALPALVVAALFAVMLLGTAYTPPSVNFSVQSNIDSNGFSVPSNIPSGGNQQQYEYQSDLTGTWATLLVTELQATDNETRAKYLAVGLRTIERILSVILYLVTLSFLLNCLLTDRRDRSILFWKSMPVSDQATVLMKLFTAVIAVPLVYFAGIAALQVSWLFLLSLSTAGTELSAWETVWAPAQLLSHWLDYLALVLINILWCLPLWGWLLVVSAYAKSVQLIWALGGPIALVFVERLVSDQGHMKAWIMQHCMPITSSANISDQLLSINMLSALITGAAMVGLAILLRGRADEL
jgi:ABC-2 type transport system permease protein